MARLNSTINIETRNLVSAFPKWSNAYSNANSNANLILNPFANVLEYAENTTAEILDDSKLLTCDVDRHPWKQWIVSKFDVMSYEVSYTTEEEFINAIRFIDGKIHDKNILVRNVTSEVDFLWPELPTQWFISGSVNVPFSGQISTFHNVNGQIKVVMLSGETYDPAPVYDIQLPNRWIANKDFSNDILITNTVNDPTYIEVNEVIQANEFNFRKLLDHQLKDKYDKITVIDENASTLSGYTIELTSGFTLLDTSDYTVRDVALLDLDGDGIVDQKELDLINAQFGKRKADFTLEEWETIYKRYDINGNLIIDEGDKNIIRSYNKTISAKHTAIEFEKPSIYRIIYTVPTDNKAAATAIIPISPTVTDIFRNNKYDYLESDWPTGYIDCTYDNDKQLFYYLDNDSKSIWAYQKDTTFGTTFDKLKILIPIKPNMDLRGIEYSNYRIYILAVINGRPKIIIVRTDKDDPDSHVFFQDINSGIRAEDSDILIRDFSGLTSAASGLTLLTDGKLLTYDEEAFKILLPLYDYYYIDNISVEGSTIHFREKYDTLTTFPSGEISPIFKHIFNRLDSHAQDKGLVRLPGEDNSSLKSRTFDVFNHFPGRDKRGIIYGIKRELGLPILDLPLENITILPRELNAENANTMQIFISGETMNYDEVVKNEIFLFGKYSHDEIKYNLSGETLLHIDRQVIL